VTNLTRALGALTVICLAVTGLGGAAFAVERNFAGSAQLDYHFVPTAPQGRGRPGGIDGFTSEVAFKVTADVSERLSANAKICYGCHGFELPMAYFDFRAFDELNIRVGRFSPSFGSFNLRHDPANHAFSSKPLPYDMGRMRRLDEWNMGVLPSPFPDNGIEIGGSHWFGEQAQLDYAVYGIVGFKAQPGATDLDWSRSQAGMAALDNNGRPTLGGRAALTLRLGADSDATAGLSAMGGPYDDEGRLFYRIFGVDLAWRLFRTHVRFEYLVRQQDFEAQAQQVLFYPAAAGSRSIINKHGAYLEVVHPASERLELAARIDGLYHQGNVLMAGPLRPRSTVLRGSVGTVLLLVDTLRLKTSVEVWSFSDEPTGPGTTEVGLHTAVVGTF
jgi:hypothetical protein